MKHLTALVLSGLTTLAASAQTPVAPATPAASRPDFRCPRAALHGG
jgi:hypothetical protein